MSNHGRFLLARYLCIAALSLSTCGGCSLVSSTKLNSLQTENRVLSDQNRAQLTEIHNLRAHTRDVENQLVKREEDIALLENQLERNRRRIASFQNEREELNADVLATLRNQDGRAAPLSEETQQRLAAINRRSTHLQFKPDSGVAKLDTDILFDSGGEELKPDARQFLGELAVELNSREARPLRVMVVGHTDDESIAKKAGRDRYDSNFQLSAARALAVAEVLQANGVPPERIAVSGYGPFQPVAPNVSPVDRRKNRRVEIFVMAPEIPVVGCTETMPGLY